MKQLTIGILAHVDAGKTTLSECMLYLAGSIRTQGRVDHGNAFLDTDSQEKKRGITIFSKQARFTYGESRICLLDTPGHVDFSTEMERTLQVLDYAILVINGMDGVQSHTRTVWNLLKRHRIPVFLFVNKMDQRGTDRDMVLNGIRKQLSESCIPFDGKMDKALWEEEIALQDEAVLEHYMKEGALSEEEIISLIAKRKVFPCYFGSALKNTGVDLFMEGISTYTKEPAYADNFGARVFKITRDASGNRLTHLKITGGSLVVKSLLGEEKINQIRLYNGAKFESAKEVKAGEICAVTGPEHTYAGQGFGVEYIDEEMLSEPVMEYRILLPEGCDVYRTYQSLLEFAEEDPQLYLTWNEKLGEIHVKLMGEVQTEIFKNRIEEKLGIKVEFGSGHIVYKETIKSMVEGVGHFEPLKHYAEVHLLLEPLEPGMGLQFQTQCSRDQLDLNWQRLILTHLAEREHPGVLTGSPITDMRITVVGGRAHDKHTEGGDFRQATYRAVRQGLKQAETVLLEPYYNFRLEVPQESVGRAMTDIQKMYGTCTLSTAEEGNGEEGFATLTGSAPVACMQGYLSEVNAYTRGMGRLTCSLKGYDKCHNEEEVVSAFSYDSETDQDNPTGSVFCAHGSGFYVNWNEVPRYMHVGSFLKKAGMTYYAGADANLGGTAGPGAGAWQGHGTEQSDEVDWNGSIGARQGAGAGRSGGVDWSDRAGVRQGDGADWSGGTLQGAGAGQSVGARQGGGAGQGVGTSQGAGSRQGRGKNADGLHNSEKRTMYGSWEQDRELEAIFERTFGKVSRRVPGNGNLGYESGPNSEEKRKNVEAARKSYQESHASGKVIQKDHYVLVDGYNVIFAWDELKELARVSLDAARGRLMDILCNYQGFYKCVLIVVFDAYKVKGNPGEVMTYHNINVVYTKEAETADMYIEKVTRQIGQKEHVTVVTSDGMEQMIVAGHGAIRRSSREFLEDVRQMEEQIRQEYLM